MTKLLKGDGGERDEGKGMSSITWGHDKDHVSMPFIEYL
jgi:hypothetical protein